MPVLISLMFGASAILLFLGVNALRQGAASQKALFGRLEQKSRVPVGSALERNLAVARRWALALAHLFPSLQQVILPVDMAQRLDHAGRPFHLTPEEIFGFQFMGVLVAFAWGYFVASTVGGSAAGLLAGIFLGAGGVFLPILWVDGEANKRQRAIGVSVPDSLELLSTLVQAGMSLDLALRHVVQRLQGPLSEEYGRFLDELNMGLPREEAFRGLLMRNRAPELRSVVEALVQGQRLGVPVGNTLQAQAEMMRTFRLQKAKELGAQASPKIALVTTMIIAPSVMCLFLTVVVFAIGRDFGPLLESFMGGP